VTNVGSVQGAKANPRRDHSVSTLLRDAQQLLRGDDYEGALDLYQLAALLAPERIELEGYVDLLRSRLVKRYRERIGGADRVPKQLVPVDQITRFNLPADAGFVLSMIDGHTSFEDLLCVTSMGPFEALRIFAGLLDAGIIGVAT
jgi:hypothetical protein